MDVTHVVAAVVTDGTHPFEFAVAGEVFGSQRSELSGNPYQFWLCTLDQHVQLHGGAEAHARGARLVSFCSGAFVLAATGLLDGRRATITPMEALVEPRARWPVRA